MNVTVEYLDEVTTLEDDDPGLFDLVSHSGDDDDDGELSLQQRLAAKWDNISKMLMSLARNPHSAEEIMGVNSSLLSQTFHQRPINPAMTNISG